MNCSQRALRVFIYRKDSGAPVLMTVICIVENITKIIGALLTPSYRSDMYGLRATLVVPAKNLIFQLNFFFQTHLMKVLKTALSFWLLFELFISHRFFKKH